MAEQISTEQTIALIEQTVADKGRDAFRVRVLRRHPSRLTPETIATFDNVTAEQITHCDMWIGRLAGGGEFLIQAFHMDAKAHAVGGFLTVKVAGEGREVDAAIVRRTDWLGPTDLVSPIARTQAPATQPSYMLGIPGDPAVPPPRNDGNGQGNGVSGVPSNQQQPPLVAYGRPDPVLEAQRMNLEQQREELRRREREQAEERHRAELDTIRRQNELELAKLRAEMLAAAKPSSDSPDKFAMILLELQKGQQESNRMMMDAIQRSTEKMTELVIKATEKKEDPLTATLLQRALDSSERQAEGYSKMMAASTEAHSGAMNMMLGAVNAISEMNQGGGEQEPAAIKLTKMIVQGITSITEGMKASAASAAIAPRPLPRPRARPAPMNGAAPVQAPAATRPPVRAVPPAEPPRRPVRRDAAAPIQQFAGVGDGSPSATRMQQLIAAIKAKDDPKVVASWFLNNLEEPTINAEMERAQGNVLVAFAPHLSAWLQESVENQHYVRDLLLAVRAQAAQRGIEMELPAEVEAVAAEVDQEGEEQDEDEEADDAQAGEVEAVEVEEPEVPGADAGEEENEL